MKVKSLSLVPLVATPWTAAYQAPPSMGFSRQECWSGVPLPSPSSVLFTIQEQRLIKLCYEVMSFGSGHNMDINSSIDLPLSFVIPGKLFKPLASVYISTK